jgi:myotubularin-related protein 3/4
VRLVLYQIANFIYYLCKKLKYFVLLKVNHFLRCSQPAVGWLGWRSSEDEDLINAIAEACAYDNGVTIDDTDSREFDSDNGSLLNDTSSIKDLSPEVAASRANGDQKKVLIVDAR